jgi:CRP/FNR family transcriptional regulator, nitrogen fixation regulation protein
VGLSGLDDRLLLDVAVAAVGELRRSHEHAILLGRKSALEKVASFLLDTAERMKSDTFELPMSTRDIADYLGLTRGTLSRIIAKLAEDCLIMMQNGRRTVLLRNKAALYRLREADQIKRHGCSLVETD